MTLDKKSTALLNIFADKASDGYKILLKTEITNALPPSCKMDDDELNAIVLFLKENEYVDVKYQDKEQICLCTTQKATAYQTGITQIKQNLSVTKRQYGVFFVLMLVASFVGTLVAAFVAKYIWR